MKRHAPLLLIVAGGKGIDLRKDARAAAWQNLPSSDSSELTDLEETIIREFERQHVELGEVARIELQTLTAAYTSIEAKLPTERDLADTVVNAAADVDRELGTASSLVILWAEREQRLRDLRIFAREHGLARDARYPTSRWLHIGVLAVLVLLESWANAGFLSEASDFGLVGGFVRACGISVLNIISGFAVGRFIIPWLAYRQRAIRVLAASGLTVGLVSAGLFNLALAGYRDQLANGIAGDQSIRDLLHDPLHLNFLSGAMFGTGLLAWALALRKGYSADDGYPGYGPLDRRLRESDLTFARARDSLVARVITRVRRVPTDCQVVLTRGHAVLDQLDGLVRDAYRVREEYETERKSVCARCTIYLRAWREENSSIRTDPAPSYFGEFPPFTTLVPEPMVGELASRAQRARTAHARLKTRAHRILLENEARLTAALERVQRYVEDLVNHATQRCPGRASAPSSLSLRSTP